MFDFDFIILFTLFIIILFVSSLIFEERQRKLLRQKEELEIKKEALETKKREETDVAFRYRKIPDELLADHYIRAKYDNDTEYMEDIKKVMLERSKKASSKEAFEYYYKIYDEWRTETNYGCF